MQPKNFSDEEMLSRLREHMVDNLLSFWTVSKPSAQAVLKRIKNDPDFAEQVRNLRAEADAKWEDMGITALLEGDNSFNVSLFKMFVGNKKPFLPHETLELSDRIEALEERLEE
jgi:hypothetical protein